MDDMSHLIFEKPSLAPLPQRVGWAFFTAVFWMVWVYLWMPLVTLIAWALGVHSYIGFFDFDESIFIKIGQMERLAFIYTSVVFLMGGSLLLWARIEFLRFHNVNRRSIPVPVTIEELASHAKLSASTLENWTAARRMVAHHDHHGRLLNRQHDALAD